MSWQADLAEAARAERARRGEVVPWLVRLDEPTDVLWATTRDAGGEWTLCAIARVLYSNRVPFDTTATSDPTIVRVAPKRPIEVLAVDEGEMRLLMATLRRYGHHGTYRKSGTRKEYKF